MTGSVCARHETFAHGADIGVRGLGASVEEAFEQAARALNGLVAELEGIAPLRAIDITCRAEDLELLLVDWLNALIFEMATRRMLFARFEVRIADGASLRARAWGEPIDVARHQPAVEPKGATYTALGVAQRADGTWTAQCVVDV